MIVTLLNFLGLILILFSIFILARKANWSDHKQSTYILLLLFLVISSVLFSNVLEHTDIYSALDRFEDYIEVLIPAFFGMLIFLYLQELRKKREKELRIREEYLNSVLTHDLRNKTQVVKGYLDLIHTKDKDSDKKIKKAKRALDETLSRADKVKHFVKRLKRKKRRCISFNKLMDIVHRGVGEEDDLIEKEDVEVVFEKFEFTGDVRADESLKNVISNIVENAIIHGESSKIKIVCKNKAKSFLISIKDDGVGIPDDLKEDIFSLDYTEKPASGGFGLYFVEKIINEYGGRIKVKDSELGGARFDIHLKKP